MVAVLTLFFRYTRIGLAFRAVADDQFAALAVGLRLPGIWATVWAAAGFVALVAGLLWGARLGVQFSLSLVVLKALPVLVLGGFDSIARRHRRRPHHRRNREARRKSISAHFVGGGIESWFAYVLRSSFLLVRPAGPVRPEARGKGLTWPPLTAARQACIRTPAWAAPAAVLALAYLRQSPSLPPTMCSTRSCCLSWR